MSRLFPRLLLALPAAMLLGGCVAVPYDGYYGAPAPYAAYPAYPAYSTYPAYPAYPAYSTYPAYSSFYFGWGGGHGRWRR